MRGDLELVVVMSARAARRLTFDEREDFDIVVLDVRLPDASGYELARELRVRLPRAAILYFSGTEDSPSRAAEQQLVAGDDFLIKPLSFEQLLFAGRKALALRRIRAREIRKPPFLVRLYESGGTQNLSNVGAIASIEKADVEVSVDRKRVEVTTSTLRILIRLMLAPEVPVPESEIRLIVHQSEAPKEWTNLVAQTIKRLRGQLDRASPGAGAWIRSRRQEGYVFSGPDGKSLALK